MTEFKNITGNLCTPFDRNKLVRSETMTIEYKI